MTDGGGLELSLVGAGGEAVDLRRTFLSHGVASLPPQAIDEDAVTLETTLRLSRSRPRVILVSAGRPGFARIEVRGRAPGAAATDEIADGVRRVLRLDEDLSAFYDLAAQDPELAWVPGAGAGRMIRSPTVFEEVVKTICTTNCTWSATERMVAALVEHLGDPATAARPGPLGRAFPTAEAMASAGERFYKDLGIVTPAVSPEPRRGIHKLFQGRSKMCTPPILDRKRNPVNTKEERSARGIPSYPNLRN